jgi:hypothetical protein
VTLHIAGRELIASTLRQPLIHPGTGSHSMSNCGSTRASW